MRRKKLQGLLAITLLLLCFASRVDAESEPVYDKAVYDPESKRYFMLLNLRAPPGTPYPRNEGLPWGEAERDARSRSYQGVQGRLAVVNTPEIHEFLLKTFRPDVETWIGLRYWCARRQLQSTDGAVHGRDAFKAWDPNWQQDVYACKSAVMNNPHEEQYMPVAYNPVSKGFRWIGKGWFKRYWAAFVEFPTGKP